MKLQQIRNATIKVDYAGKRFLVDPMLSSKGAFPGFEGTVASHRSNPTVDLPVSTAEILDVDAVVVTHTHPDHWDEAARNLVPKDLPFFAQNLEDAQEIEASGFRDIRVLGESTLFDGVTLVKTPGRHGRDEILAGPLGERLGTVCGVVLQHPDEKTLYVAGDTVWCQAVEDTLGRYAPDVVVLNCGDAKVLPDESIIMGKQDLLEVYTAAPDAIIVASHMESVNHATLSRTELRRFLSENGMTRRVLVPEDGESYSL